MSLVELALRSQLTEMDVEEVQYEPAWVAECDRGQSARRLSQTIPNCAMVRSQPPMPEAADEKCVRRHNLSDVNSYPTFASLMPITHAAFAALIKEIDDHGDFDETTNWTSPILFEESKDDERLHTIHKHIVVQETGCQTVSGMSSSSGKRLAPAPMPALADGAAEVPISDELDYFDAPSGVVGDESYLHLHLTASDQSAARYANLNLYNVLIIRVFVLYGRRILFKQRCPRIMTVGDILIHMGKNPRICVLKRNDTCLTNRERIGDWGDKIVVFELVYRWCTGGQLRGMEIPSTPKYTRR